MAEIDLPLYEITSGDRTHIVSARIVDVAPHLAHVATFAVHRNPWSFGGWRISNVETGMKVGAADDATESLCVESAVSYLARKTEDDVIRAFKAISGGMTPNVRSNARP